MTSCAATPGDYKVEVLRDLTVKGKGTGCIRLVQANDNKVCGYVDPSAVD